MSVAATRVVVVMSPTRKKICSFVASLAAARLFKWVQMWLHITVSLAELLADRGCPSGGGETGDPSSPNSIGIGVCEGCGGRSDDRSMYWTVDEEDNHG